MIVKMSWKKTPFQLLKSEEEATKLVKKLFDVCGRADPSKNVKIASILRDSNAV